ncbi:MAG TPA: hypothetical protein VLJ80_06730 [Solirubrobacteraceae bacterium]|nr:hypothetical protein [Solirubrobacteraceae bacterium]
MLEATLPNGLRSRVHRDGMLAYDFGDGWHPGDRAPDGGIAAHARRIQVINAHLACIKASLTTGFNIAPATGETVVGVAYELNDELARHGGVTAAIGETGMLMMALAQARVEGPNGPFDWRFQRVGAAIAVGEIDRSYALLREMLESPRRADALLYAELLLRAQASMSIDDSAGALVYAWTAAEGMLRSLFSRWVDECGKEVGPDAQGHERVFLDANRRKSLEGGSITGWHMAEIGSLVGWLPFDLYRTIRNCAKARNDWLHKQDLRALEHAPEAIQATQQLFSLTEGIDLTPGRVGSISITQRLPSKSDDE